MEFSKPKTAFLHYSASPIVGGVEAVMDAHARIFVQMGYPVTVIAGQGSINALPAGTEFEHLPLLDSQHPDILSASAILERGRAPDTFSNLTQQLEDALAAKLNGFNNVIVHNVLTKHFNLPLTAAIFRLLDAGAIQNCIAWGHDFTWTSPNSRSKVHPGYPWDLLRTRRSDVTYVTVSQKRQRELASLYDCPIEKIHVIYNGVEPAELLGLTVTGWELAQRMDLLANDLVLLMPVRVTQAKNIEYALKVIAALKAGGLQVKLVLTGPPDPHDEKSMVYFRSLQELRSQLNLEQEMRFVYESGLDPDEPNLISLDVVADLYRLADLMIMPSHREGFGMPVLEAGLLGLPVVVSDAVPAAGEIGGEEVMRFDPDLPPHALAEQIIAWSKDDHRLRLTRRIRQNFTWQAIFQRDIEPLLHQSDIA